MAGALTGAGAAPTSPRRPRGLWSVSCGLGRVGGKPCPEGQQGRQQGPERRVSPLPSGKQGHQQRRLLAPESWVRFGVFFTFCLKGTQSVSAD